MSKEVTAAGSAILKAWAIKAPDGAILLGTVAGSQSEAWERHAETESEWETKSAKDRGYTAISVFLLSPGNDREVMERQVIAAAMNLAGATLAHEFSLPVPNTTPPLYVSLHEAISHPAQDAGLLILRELLKHCDSNPEGETDFERAVIAARAHLANAEQTK